jgi:hypothetical protein
LRERFKPLKEKFGKQVKKEKVEDDYDEAKMKKTLLNTT